jgi:hypothetical protein
MYISERILFFEGIEKGFLIWPFHASECDLQNVDPTEISWKVEGVIYKIHGRWEAWFAKVILQTTPSTSHEISVGSTSCDSDWSFHSLHEEVGFH